MKLALSQAALKTKLKALKANFLSNSDWEIIQEINSPFELVSFLSKHNGFKDYFNFDTNSLSRTKIEQRLMLSIYRDLEKIYYFSNLKERAFLKIYFEKYEINAIKNMLHKILGLNNDDIQKTILLEEIAFFDKYLSIDLKRLYNATNPKSFIKFLKGTNYYKVLMPLIDKENFTPFECDMLLDGYRYTNMLKIAKKSLKKKKFISFKKTYDTLIDITNIYYIYRAKKYYELSNIDLYTITLPTNTFLSKNLVNNLINASNMEEFEKFLKTSPYKKYFNKYKLNNISEYFNEILEHAVYNTFNSESYESIIIKHIHKKETEKNNLIKAIENIKYKSNVKGELRA